MTDSDQDDGPPDLVVPQASCVVDPVLADVVEKGCGIAACANPTHDPDRMTLHVPSEHTVLSLGAPSPAANWNTDIGITGYSNRHIHFETKTNDKTIVSLGTGATTTAIVGHDPVVPAEMEGYAMVTDEFAWHQATGQHYVISQEGDVSIRTMGAGKRAVVQADAGHVDLNGGEEVTLTSTAVAIGAKQGFPIEDITYDQPWNGKSPEFTFTENASTGVDCLSALVAVHDLALTAIGKYKAYKKGELAFDEYNLADAASWLGDTANFVIAAGKLKDTFTHATSPPGCVKLSAEKDLVGLGMEVGLFGRRGASIGSVAATGLGAGLMCTLKSALFCGVGGLLTTLKAVKKIEVVSCQGDVVVGAKKNVELTSDLELIAGSDELAQVTSERAVVMGGAKGVWVGNDQWGMRMSGKEIAFGAADGTAKLYDATVKDSPAIRVDEGKIEIVGTDGAITLSDDLCLIEAPSVDIKAQSRNVTFTASGMFKID